MTHVFQESTDREGDSPPLRPVNILMKDNTMITFALAFVGILAFLVLLYIIEAIYYAIFPNDDER